MQTKINKWFPYLIMFTFVIGIGLLTGCEKDETDDTIRLDSFGPSPALRGSSLRFIGNNLNEVKAVVFPGLTEGETVEVTDITVVDEKEIKVEIGRASCRERV